MKLLKLKFEYGNEVYLYPPLVGLNTIVLFPRKLRVPDAWTELVDEAGGLGRTCDAYRANNPKTIAAATITPITTFRFIEPRDSYRALISYSARAFLSNSITLFFPYPSLHTTRIEADLSGTFSMKQKCRASLCRSCQSNSFRASPDTS